ncbi:MAG: MMPL family transporter [Proteobacteria bacterium]|nr:MMPL family transporter [Pseudomonadota bacterium]
MTTTPAQAYRQALVRWTDGVRRLAWLVVAASVLLSAAAVVYLAENIRINTDTSDMLSADLAFRRHSAELNKAFPQFSDNLIVVIDGDSPDLSDDAARALAERLRRQPKLFGRVDDPAGSDFLRRNGLLYLDLDDLYELSDRLAEAQPFLGALWRDPSLVGLFRMLDLAIDEFLKDPAEAPFELMTVLDALADVAEAQKAGKFSQLSWQTLMTGAVAPEDEVSANRRVLVLQPALDFKSLSPAAKAMKGVRAAVRDLGLTRENGVRVRLTGSAALAHEELQSVEKGMGVAGAVSLFLVVVLLLIGFRSLRLAAAALATLLMGLIWTAAFAILALGALNLISVAFAVLFIGLSVDFGIHYGLRYKEGMDRDGDHARALSEAAEQVGGALTLCALSAAIAFYSFLPTDYLGLAELGLIAGTGMFIAFFANITVLPALLTVMPRGRGFRKGGAGGGGMIPVKPVFQSFIRFNSRAVCFSALAVGVAAAFVVPKVMFDFDPLNLKDPKTESVATIFDLMENNRTSPYSITVLTRNLDAAQALAGKMNALSEVDGTATLADYVPADQPEKLDLIATMGLFLMPSFASAGTDAPPSMEDRRAALGQIRGRLGKLSALQGAAGEAKAAGRLSRALAALFGDGPANEAGLKELETRLLAALPGRLDALNLSLTAEPVDLNNLPPDMAANQVAADGRARLEVYPKEDLRDREALRRFVQSVRGVADNAIGSSVVILEAGNAVVAAFWQAGIISVTLISLLLMAVLKRWLDMVLVFAPLTLAALLTVAASVIFDIPFNFANIIVLPLLFGLGVASGIHLVLRQREEKSVSGVLETSTPRAVVFSALTTIGSFGSIALSSHPGTASMGLLLTISIALTLGCTLVVLPALMVAAGNRMAVDQRE